MKCKTKYERSTKQKHYILLLIIIIHIIMIIFIINDYNCIMCESNWDYGKVCQVEVMKTKISLRSNPLLKLGT